MTLSRWAGFALLPKRCDICNRVFWLESYDIFTRELGIEHRSVGFIKCKECIAKGKSLWNL